jgi:hypothetical protein
MQRVFTSRSLHFTLRPLRNLKTCIKNPKEVKIAYDFDDSSCPTMNGARPHDATGRSIAFSKKISISSPLIPGI